jgi:lysozyme
LRRPPGGVILDPVRWLSVLPAAASVLGGVGPAEADAWRPRCARGATLRGIDVSKWQGEIDWDAVKRDGIEFAFMRVSDGSDRPDPTFERNWAEAGRVGLARGAYQYFRPLQDPEEQADLLLAAIGPPGARDLAPVIDIEVSDGVAPRELARRIDRWAARVRKATGMRPLVYTSAKTWVELVAGSGKFRRHALWIAHYDVDCPNTPTAWRRWTIHQVSQQAQVAGIATPVDENRFHGSRRALARLGRKPTRAALARYRRWQRIAEVDRRRREAEAAAAETVPTSAVP